MKLYHSIFMGNVKALVLLSKILFERRSPRDDIANLVIF